MKTFFHSLCVALGFTTLCFAYLLPFSGWVAFHWSGTPASLFLPGLLDFVLVWFLLTLVLYLLWHHTRARNLVWAAMIVFLPSILIEQRLMNDEIFMSTSVHRGIDLACLLLWLAVATFLYKALAAHAETFMLPFGFLSVAGVILLTHALWFGWSSRHLNPPFQPKTLITSHAPNQPRILWIVMDELPYRFIYDHRPNGLDLPAFDALAAQASVFTHVTPPSDTTEYVMPSYLTGIDVQALSQRLDGTFSLRDGSAHLIPFDQHNTIFQDARSAGYSTAAAGWFIPYCRVLPDVLDRCVWTYGEPLSSGMSASASLVENIAAPLLFAAPHLLPSTLRLRFKIPTNRYRRVNQHIQDYLQLHRASEQLLRDPSIGFVLLHLPVPHNPDMYDRRTKTLHYVAANSLLDNLALADRCLAELRSILEETHQWDNTTILLMGDHGWRGEGPEGMGNANASSDRRQAYIVKLAHQQAAHQQAAQTIATPYNALRTRALLQALTQQKIHTPADLQAWVESSR